MKCPFKFGNYDFEGAEDCIGAECGMFKLCNAETEITAVEFDALDDYAQALERENAELKARVNELEAELCAREKYPDGFMSVNEMRKELGELQSKVDVLDIENSELCDEIDALNELRGELTRERDGYHEEKVRLEMELAQAQGLLSNVTHNHAAAKAKYERAQIDAKRARERQEEAERKYDELLKKPPEGAWAERAAELEAELATLRDKLGRMLDCSHEIERIGQI